MIRRFVAKALASSFIRQSTILASGTVAANLITLLMLPLFTRLFTAEAFGLQALLILGTMALGTLGTGYYDWAIPTPKTKKQAKELATLALGLSVAVAIIGSALLLVFGQSLLDLLAMGSVHAWGYLLPWLGLSLACYNIGNYWLLRAGDMKHLTQIRFILPVTNAVVSFILGMQGHDAGLVIGFIAGVGVSGVWGLALAMRHGLAFDFSHPRTHYQALASKFREFPLFGSIPATAMLIAGQIPLLVITGAYALDFTGHYAVVRAIVFTGTLMVATACGQVILKHVADAKNRHDDVWAHFTRMFGLLAAIGIVGGVAVYFISPIFFRLYLGEAWGDAAQIAQYMAFALPLWLLGIALASAPIALKRLKLIAAWQVSYGLAACYLFTLTDLPFMVLVQKVILFEIVAYALYILASAISVRQHAK